MAYRCTKRVKTNMNHFDTIEDHHKFLLDLAPVAAIDDLLLEFKTNGKIIDFSHNQISSNEFVYTRTWIDRPAYDEYLRRMLALYEAAGIDWSAKEAELGWTAEWSEEYDVVV